MRTYPALDALWTTEPDDEAVDVLLAAADDYQPQAIDRIPCGVRLYFSSPDRRDEACAALTGRGLGLTPRMVPDDGWAERSQASVTPVRVGRIVVTPPWYAEATRRDASPSDVVIVVLPSMGFGTGHHASTRLCLRLLQQEALSGRVVVDIGTGSGVLAAAAVGLGATRADAVDVDPDAVAAASDTIRRNGLAARVSARVSDFTRGSAVARYDLALGNLTGGVLARHASQLIATLRPGGTLIVSGLQVHERDEVVTALAAVGATLVEEAAEDEWAALRLAVPTASPTGSRAS